VLDLPIDPTSPQYLSLLVKVFIGLQYETAARASELLSADVGDLDMVEDLQRANCDCRINLFSLGSGQRALDRNRFRWHETPRMETLRMRSDQG
jgi:hypothetical protein